MAPPNKIQDLFAPTGLVAVITGGGSGLGLYAARALDANGAKAVYIVGRRGSVLTQAAKTDVNGTIKPLVGDVTDKASLQRVADTVRQEQGYINLLFANAGVSGPPHASALKKEDGSQATVEEFQKACFEPSMEDFTAPAHVNSTAVFYTAVAFLDLLAKGNEQRNVPQDSQILVTSSIAGLSRQLASSFAYSASKAATTHLVKMLATRFAQNGFRIRANVIAPGLYPSQMTESTVQPLEGFGGVKGHEGVFGDAHVMSNDQCPGGRTGSEQDFAGAVLFMAGRAGAYLNGEVLVTDGGRLSQLPGSY